MSRSKGGERPWNGKFTLRKPRSRVSQTGVGRKLEEIRRELVLLGEQGKTKGFFNNAENAEKLVGLVEDLRDVMMDYQVCSLSNVSFSHLTYFQTALQQDMYNRSFLLIVSLIHLFWLDN